MKNLFLVSCFVFIFSGLAQAAPPLQISDTGTPGDGQWEINVGLSGEKSLSHFQTVFHALDLNYGFGERIQLKYELPWIFSKEEGAETKDGVGNSVLGIKWLFLDEERQGIAMSVYPQVEFNTARSSVDKGLVDKGTKWLLPLEVERKIGSVNVVGELGYIYNPEMENQWLYGLALGYKTSKHFELVGELYGIASSNLDWATHDLVFNLGFRWNLIKWLNWNTSVGRSLHSVAGNEKTLLFYTGVQFVF
jgi:hypothetical protein